MDHHITHMDADAKPELPVLRNPLVLLPQPLLYLHRTLNRVHHARELGEHAVPGRVGYPSPVLSDQPVHDLTMIGECSHRPHFVLTHEARVTRHVGREDRCELPFDWLGGRGHGVPTHRRDGDIAPKLGGRIAQRVSVGSFFPRGSDRTPKLHPHQWPPPVSPVSSGSIRYCILLLGTAIQRPRTSIRTPCEVTRNFAGMRSFSEQQLKPFSSNR